MKTINQIIKGTAQIMPETALQLEKVTGVPASFWNNAESNYREHLARLEDEKRQQRDVGWLKRFSYTKMAGLGLVTAVADKAARVGQLLRYFGVATSKQWEITYSAQRIEAKLRALAEHPATPEPERLQALAALRKLAAKDAGDASSAEPFLTRVADYELAACLPADRHGFQMRWFAGKGWRFYRHQEGHYIALDNQGRRCQANRLVEVMKAAFMRC